MKISYVNIFTNSIIRSGYIANYESVINNNSSQLLTQAVIFIPLIWKFRIMKLLYDEFFMLKIFVGLTPYPVNIIQRMHFHKINFRSCHRL